MFHKLLPSQWSTPSANSKLFGASFSFTPEGPGSANATPSPPAVLQPPQFKIGDTVTVISAQRKLKSGTIVEVFPSSSSAESHKYLIRPNGGDVLFAAAFSGNTSADTSSHIFDETRIFQTDGDMFARLRADLAKPL